MFLGKKMGYLRSAARWLLPAAVAFVVSAAVFKLSRPALTGGERAGELVGDELQRGAFLTDQSELEGVTLAEPGNDMAWLLLAFTDEKLGQDRAALAAYRRALQLNPSFGGFDGGDPETFARLQALLSGRPPPRPGFPYAVWFLACGVAFVAGSCAFTWALRTGPSRPSPPRSGPGAAQIPPWEPPPGPGIAQGGALSSEGILEGGAGPAEG